MTDEKPNRGLADGPVMPSDGPANDLGLRVSQAVLIVDKNESRRRALRNALWRQRLPSFEAEDSFVAMAALGRADFVAVVAAEDRRAMTLRSLFAMARKRHDRVALFVLLSDMSLAAQLRTALQVPVTCLDAATPPDMLGQAIASSLTDEESEEISLDEPAPADAAAEGTELDVEEAAIEEAPLELTPVADVDIGLELVPVESGDAAAAPTLAGEFASLPVTPAGGQPAPAVDFDSIPTRPGANAAAPAADFDSIPTRPGADAAAPAVDFDSIPTRPGAQAAPAPAVESPPAAPPEELPVSLDFDIAAPGVGAGTEPVPPADLFTSAEVSSAAAALGPLDGFAPVEQAPPADFFAGVDAPPPAEFAAPLDLAAPADAFPAGQAFAPVGFNAPAPTPPPVEFHPPADFGAPMDPARAVDFHPPPVAEFAAPVDAVPAPDFFAHADVPAAGGFFAPVEAPAPAHFDAAVEAAPPAGFYPPADVLPAAEFAPPVEAAPSAEFYPDAVPAPEFAPPVEAAPPAEFYPDAIPAPEFASPVDAAPPAEFYPDAIPAPEFASPVDAAPPAEFYPDAIPAPEFAPPVDAAPPAEFYPDAVPAPEFAPPVEAAPPAEFYPPADVMPSAEFAPPPVEAAPPADFYPAAIPAPEFAPPVEAAPPADFFSQADVPAAGGFFAPPVEPAPAEFAPPVEMAPPADFSMPAEPPPAAAPAPLEAPPDFLSPVEPAPPVVSAPVADFAPLVGFAPPASAAPPVPPFEVAPEGAPAPSPLDLELDDLHLEVEVPPLLEGSLEDTSAAAVLMTVFAQQLTGRLLIHGGEAEGQLFFLQGHPVSVALPGGREALLQRLYDRELLASNSPIPDVDEPHLVSALQAQGLLEGAAVQPFLRELLRAHVMAFCQQRQGTYRFASDEHFAQERTLLKVNPFGLLVEVRRGSMDPDMLLAEGHVLKKHYIIAGPALAEAGAALKPFMKGHDPAEIITGNLTVEEFWDSSSLGTLMGTLMLLILVEARLAHFSTTPHRVEQHDVTLAPLVVAPPPDAAPMEILLEEDIIPIAEDTPNQLPALYHHLRSATDPFTVLQVPPDATEEEVGLAYRLRLAELARFPMPEGADPQQAEAWLQEMRHRYDAALQAVRGRA